MTELRSKLEQHLGQGILALLFLGCLVVLWPFVTALLWATVLSFSMWPLYSRLANLLGGRRTLAALLLSLAMIVAVVLPLGIVGLTLGENVAELKSATWRILDKGVPAAPEWLEKIPLVGSAAKTSWNNMASDRTKLIELAKSLIEPVGSWLLKAGLTLGSGLGQLALSVLLTFFLLRHGAASAANVSNGIRRIAGERGTHLLNVAGDTVRGVVYGILGTAIVQAVMAGFGFFVAGVPGAGLLAVITFFVSVVPLGPPLIWLPAALWLFYQGSTGWGVFMLVWGLGVSTVDNLVKPWLISQGSDMPFILILFGVLGGALGFGFIGVFLGPTLLAVGYRILKEWSALDHTSEIDGSKRSEPIEGSLAPGEALSKSR
jgi:predicted PurR-regulated permease PerM